MDGDGDGGITAAELRQMLLNLSLSPTAGDLATLARELEVGRTGLISKEALVQYVKNGGRTAAVNPVPSGRNRRHDSLYRVYSIENYTLANALSEMSAAVLPPGLRSGPTLKDIAAATMGTKSVHPVSPPPAPSATASTTSDVEQHLLRASAVTDIDGHRTVSDSSGGHGSHGGTEEPMALQLPPFLPPPGEQGWAASLQQQQQATLTNWLAKPSPLSQPAAEAESNGGLLAWLVGSSLRSTPSASAQYWILLLRAAIKYARQWPSKAMDIMLLLLAAMVCGEHCSN